MATKKTELAKIEESSLALSTELPEWLRDKGGNRGAENVGVDDIIIPRIEIVQSLSPARKKSDPAYIEGAEEGMLFNNVTRELYGASVIVVPVYYSKQYLIWKDRKAGGGTGGFRGAYNSLGEAHEQIQTLGEEALDVAETAQHFCLIHSRDKWEEAVVSMSKSKLKISKRWNSLMRLTNTDSFSRAYKLSSTEESNARGETYYNFSITSLGFVPANVFVRAEELYHRIRQGGIKVSSDFDNDSAETVQTGSEY
jgi:hypothetical protein